MTKFLKTWKEESLLILLGAISLMGIFIASSDPIISVLEGTLLENLLISVLSGNSIVFNLSIGIFVSTIFYVMIVYIPEKRKNAKIKPTIFMLVENIISSGARVALEVNNQAPNGKKLKSIKNFSQEELFSVSKEVNPKASILSSNSGIPMSFNKTKGQMIREKLQQAEQDSDLLIKYLPYVDAGIIHEVTKLSRCSPNYLINILEHPDVSNSDLSVFSKNIFDYHQQVKVLAVYYKNNVNSSYTPEWFDI